MAGHCNDPLRTHLLRGEHAEETNGAVPDDCHRRTRFDIRRLGSEPAGTENIGGRQQAREQVVRREVLSRNERPIREWDAQHWGLRTNDGLHVLAAGRVSVATVRAGVVRREERSNDELTAFDGFHAATDFFDDAAILVTHRRRLLHFIDAAIRPKV